MHWRIGQRGHEKISIWITLAKWRQVGERIHLLLLFLLAFLFLAVLIRCKRSEEGHLLPFLAGRGGLGLGLQQMKSLAVLLCR